MPGDEPFAIARRALDDLPDDGGIDPRLATALVDAVVDYPTFATACAACGVTVRSVQSMLQRGAQPGAVASLRAFSRAMAKADADNARLHYQAAQVLIAKGQSAAARLMTDLLTARWRTEEEQSIMSMISGGRRSDGLKARLERPGPMLGALLSEMLKEPNGAWADLLRGAGLVREMAPAPEPEAQETPEEEPREGRSEGDEDGDRV